MNKPHIAIIGNGLTAYLMSEVLKYSNYECIWFQNKNSLKKFADNRTVTLNQASARMLNTLGIWKKLSHEPHPINSIMVSNGLPKNKEDWILNWKNENNPMAYVINNQDLFNTLLKFQKKNSRINRHYLKNIKIDKNNINIIDTNNNFFNPDLTIACDGSNSLFHDLKKIKKYYNNNNQVALVANIKTEANMNNSAYQRFLSEGPLALMPKNSFEASMVWSVSNDSLKKYQSINQNNLNKLLNKSFGNELGNLEIVTELIKWPLKPFYLKKLTYPGLVLIGDAGHVIHPLAGMGFNLALSDSAIMLDCLNYGFKHGLNSSHPFILNNFENKRKLEIFSFTVATQLLNKLFSSEQKPLLKLAEIGMIMLNKTSLKNVFRKISEGDIFSSASLLKGKLPN